MRDIEQRHTVACMKSWVSDWQFIRHRHGPPSVRHHFPSIRHMVFMESSLEQLLKKNVWSRSTTLYTTITTLLELVLNDCSRNGVCLKRLTSRQFLNIPTVTITVRMYWTGGSAQMKSKACSRSESKGKSPTPSSSLLWKPLPFSQAGVAIETRAWSKSIDQENNSRYLHS